MPTRAPRRRASRGALTASLTAAVALGAVLPGHVAGQDAWSILGRVVDASSMEPVRGARVHLEELEQDYLTNDDGRFLILDLHERSVTLVVEALGYASTATEVAATGGQRVVEIELSQEALQLEGLEVGVRHSAVDLDVPQSTSRLTQVDIIRERGQTLGETLSGVEGVSIIQYGPSIAKPVVRGLHSQRIVVMNDGVRQEGQQWGGEHAPEVDVFGVNEIEVVRGPSSVLYGSDALGGVLRIQPAPAPYGSDLGGEAVFNSFTNNRQFSGSLMLEHGSMDAPLLGTVGGRFRLSGRKSGDAHTADYNLTNTGFTELNAGVTLGLQRDWGDVELDVSRFSTEIGLFTGAHFGNFDDLMRAMERGPRITEFDYAIDNPRQEVTHDAVRLDTHLHAGRAGNLETIYAFQLNRRREFDNHGRLSARTRPAFGLDLYTHTLESRLEHPEVWGLEGTLGVSAMRQGNISTGKGFLIPQFRLYSGAVFLSEETEVGPLTVSGGARYEYRWQRVYGIDDFGIDVPDETKVYDDVAASFGVSLPLGDTWSIGATTGRAWRAPNVNERYSQGIHHGTAQYELGDAALTKERTWNVDATLRRSGESFDLQLSTYRNAIRGYIYLEPRDPVLTIRGAYPAFAFSQTDAVISGVEGSIRARFIPGLELRAMGNLLRGTEAADGAPLYDMPADRMQVGARLMLPAPSWATSPFLDVEATLVREQDRVPVGIIYALPTDGYQLVDLELGAQSLEIAGRRVDAGLEIRNVLDTAYRDYLSRYKLFVDDPGRDIVLRIRVPLGGTY